MRRRAKGSPIRAAMKAAGLDIAGLAEATKLHDPAGRGLSRTLVGFTTSSGKSGREECSTRAAELISAALHQEVAALFETEVLVAKKSTSTPRTHTGRRNATGDMPDRLMTATELCQYLRKSPSWLTGQIKNDPDYPVEYIGGSRRFDPVQVIAYYRAKRRQLAA